MGIESKVNTPKKYEVKLVSPDGKMMDYPPGTSINDIFQVPADNEGELADKVKQLVDMGFPIVDVQAALKRCSGDMERSLSTLVVAGITTRISTVVSDTQGAVH